MNNTAAASRRPRWGWIGLTILILGVSFWLRRGSETSAAEPAALAPQP